MNNLPIMPIWRKTMPPKILVFGNDLSRPDWKKGKGKSNQDNNIALITDPTIPDMKCSGGTAFVDLEKSEFSRSEFLLQLAKSFDKLRIVGVADSPVEEETFRVAECGVAEILTKEQYFSRVESIMNGPVRKEIKEVIPAEKDSEKQFGVSSIIGHSPKIVQIKTMLEHLRDVDYPNAVIFGETGTGKDLLAKVMHYSGLRRDKNFIEVNCSAIPDALFESELFGHAKGAFTDAKSDKTGLFEFASEGTIFLDEIGNLTMSAQAKLLKILENRKLRRLGAVEEIDINVRVLAATNANLEQAVAEGRFRQDLLFRLNLIAIHIPPLRERKEDIPDLARYNFNFYKALYDRANLSMHDDAIDVLLKHSWPGNVRELRNVMERAVLLAGNDAITSIQISEAVRNGRVTLRERKRIFIEIPDNGINLRAIEKQVVGEILNMVQWNRTAAAQMLGISRARLRRIMDETGLVEKRQAAGTSGT
jgi:transcriptional regulator with PAS, ATPase and Fis domain